MDFGRKHVFFLSSHFTNKHTKKDQFEFELTSQTHTRDKPIKIICENKMLHLLEFLAIRSKNVTVLNGSLLLLV